MDAYGLPADYLMEDIGKCSESQESFTRDYDQYSVKYKPDEEDDVLITYQRS